MKKVRWIILVALLLGAAALRLWDFTSPWTNDYRGWGGSFYSNIARNYLKFGYIETKAAPVSSINPPDAAHFEYYLHHPPMTGWLVSLSFRLFGYHEWAARIIPVLCSMGALVLLYLIMRRFWNAQTSLIGLALAAVVPMAAFYGSFVDVQGPIPLFFTMLTFYLYLRFDERRTWGRWLWVLGAFFLAALCDWPAYYIVPFIVLHHVFSKGREGRRQRRKWRILLLPALAVVIFAAFLTYADWVEHGEVSFDVREMAGCFLYRAFATSGDNIDDEAQFTAADWFNKHSEYFHVMFTIPVLVLTTAGLVFYIYKVITRTLERGSGIIAIFLTFGLLHVVIFRQGAFVHEYWGYYLYPALAMLAAVFCTGVSERLLPHSSALRNIFCLAVVLPSLLVATLSCVNLEHTRNSADFATRGRMIGEEYRREYVILADKRLGWNYQFAFHLDNYVEFARPFTANLQVAADLPDGGIFFLSRRSLGDMPSEEFRRRLAQRGGYLFASALVIDVTGMSPELGEVKIPRPYDIEAEYDGENVTIRWKHDQPEKVKHYIVYARTDTQTFFSERFPIGNETETSAPYRLYQPKTITVTAVDEKGNETGFTNTVRITP
jgi:4-amino-4-deoxy-L-arabinose transferase-like glycosyltransferase